jgi:hypothetical protein
MADIAGLILGIPGLIQTCLFAYKTLISTASMNREVRSLILLLEIEGNRLVVAGKCLGIIDSAANSPADPKHIIKIIRQRIPNDASIQLAHRILDNIHNILTDLECLSKRYGFEIDSMEVSWDPANRQGRNLSFYR